VDLVIIIFKIANQDIVAMCIMGCGKTKFRNTPLVNNPVYIILKNFSLNLRSKMFVLTELIDCIFLLFSKTLSPFPSISPLY
jgi:hypothetical protein